MADHRDHRVADILDPLGQNPGFDRREPGMAQIELDQLGMPAIVQRAPDRHRLGPEAAVREADDERRAGPQHPPDIAQYGDRLLQILDRHADHRRVDAGVGERQPGFAVEVLDEPTIEPRVGGQLGGVQAMADHLAVADLRWQMADPAAHQVEQYAAGGQYAAELAAN